ncbi:MAG: type 2 lanthipeptide synthetase LanM family protein [Solirubrobacterales bacterium]
MALACAPFSRLLTEKLTVAASRAGDAREWEGLVDPAIGDAFSEHLIDRFELAVAWAVEADEKVAFARSGVAPEDAAGDDHDAYFAARFGSASGYHAFYLRFPVLARWLAAVTGLLLDAGCELIGRLAADAEEIGTELFGEPVVAFTSVELGSSDYHAGGRSVTMVGVELGSGTASFVYKPRCLGGERAMQGLLARLAEDGVADFARRRVLCKEGYGYEERIAQAGEVGSTAQARRFYEELGGLLAVFYLLGGSDLHHENVMVADGHPVVCDCETALGVHPPGQEPAVGTVVDSVYRTGLLDWPVSESADVVTRLGGFLGGEPYELPFAVPRLQEGSSLAVKYERGVRVEQSGSNRIRLGGRLVDPRDYGQAIVDGFERVHDWFRLTADAGELVAGLFAGTEARLVARNTQVYAQMLVAARHPGCLIEPLEVDLVLAKVSETPLPWDRQGLVEEAEARALWQLDVPRFTVAADGTELRDDRGAPLQVTLERSPLSCALERIAGLTVDDRRRQVGYIEVGLSPADVHSPAFARTALDYAHTVAEELCIQMDDPDRGPRWTYRTTGDEASDVSGTLYYGSAGVALFLAYLDAIEPRPELRRAARQALRHAIAHRPPGIGAFDGLAGEVYLLTHLYRLWGEPELKARAIELSESLEDMIDDDRVFDVLSGSAGVIAVLLGLDAATGVGLSGARRCARHLLHHAQSVGESLSWPTPDAPGAQPALTGFAHGSGGIGWALILLAAQTGEEEYLEAGRRAFAHERIHFDEERRDWYDLRPGVVRRDGGRHFSNAWCNGAPGIGLSRLGSLAALGREDDLLLGEVYLALSSTLRHFAAVGNDTLCHGRSGNAELFLRFGLERGEPALQLEAQMQAQACWSRLAAARDWPRLEDGRQPLSGLMAGISGSGMHFLRLACPDRVPSPLLLDPPPEP